MTIDKRSSDEKQQQKDAAKRERYRPETEQLLRQFLTMESTQAQTPEYDRGFDFSFRFTQEQRDEAFKLMGAGMSFEDAFEKVRK